MRRKKKKCCFPFFKVNKNLPVSFVSFFFNFMDQQRDTHSRVSAYRSHRSKGGDMVSTPHRTHTPSRDPSVRIDRRVGSSSGHHPAVNDERENSRPNDLTTYILELEAQNRELRQHIAALQLQLGAARAPSMSGQGSVDRLREVMGEEGAKAVTNTLNATHHRTLATEAERKAFLTDILSQIEVVIQAHRNKTFSEVARYKTEAESAREALRALREVIQQEGMDMTLAPGLLNAQKVLGAAGRASASELALPPESELLLGGISQDMLRRLVALDDSADLASAVKEEVRRGFTVVVRHFAQQLVLAANDSAAAMADQRAEMDRLKDELRTQLHMSETRRMQMVQQHDIEVMALRDELHAFNVAASEDDIERNLHQRALEEYNRMLVESRTETAGLRKALDDEKNHSAEVCLRLKSALQRRSAEFEKTIVEQAEALVKEREATISDLRKEIDVLKGPPKTFSSIGCQIGESNIVPVDADNYVSNVLRAMKRDPKSIGETTEKYERELWRHTQDLIQRYGGVLPQQHAPTPNSILSRK